MANKGSMVAVFGTGVLISYNVFSDLLLTHQSYGTGGASFSFDADTSHVVARHNFDFFLVSCVW